MKYYFKIPKILLNSEEKKEPPELSQIYKRKEKKF